MPKRGMRAEQLVDRAVDVGVDAVFDRATKMLDGFFERQRDATPRLPHATQIKCAVCWQSFAISDVEFVSPHPPQAGHHWGTCRRCFKIMYDNLAQKLEALRSQTAQAAKNVAGQAAAGARPKPPPGPMPWEILGVARDADADTVKRAYRALALQWHPDRVPPGAPDGERERARAEFEKIDRAYNVMMRVRKAAT